MPIPDFLAQEITAEGFTEPLIKAFLNTAKITKTVVSSRLPGGVGLDLIQEKCDLKGFHIKAKSCNWGPMAGFICQLPMFNKYGFEKIDYNAKNIFHYLDRLHFYKEKKIQIAAVEKNRDDTKKYLLDQFEIDLTKGTDVLAALMSTLKVTSTSDQQYLEMQTAIADLREGKVDLGATKSKLRIITGKICDLEGGKIVKRYLEAENISGDWSGENTIEDDLPFINLKRKFATSIDDTIAIVKKMQGVETTSVIAISEGIYGLAKNVNDEATGVDGGSTIFTEFLLVKDGDTSLWYIYHGDIFVKAPEKERIQYIPSSITGSDMATKIVEIKWFEDTLKDHPITNELNKEHLTDLLKFSTDTKSFSLDASTAPFKAGSRVFNAVRGFVNPHPPYKKSSADLYYKNAVSGDYDLFAYWPQTTVPQDELKRLSEQELGYPLKYYPGDTARLGIEFIPGFSELNPTTERPRIIESAEFGNVNRLSNSVTGYLNALAFAWENPTPETAGTDEPIPIPGAVAVNKAFHSDEGGRPGIMEVEFPIAFFFPHTISTAALNNKYIKDEPIPPLAGRTKIDANMGLIKTPEEFLLLIQELNDQPDTSPTERAGGGTDVTPKYQILLQSEWISHFLFLTIHKDFAKDIIDKKPRTAAIWGMLEKNFKEETLEGEDLVKRRKAIDKKMKEFVKITKNNDKIYYGASSFDEVNFKKEMIKLLGLRSDVSFFDIRILFFKLAFQSERPAAQRMNEAISVFTNQKVYEERFSH